MTSSATAPEPTALRRGLLTSRTTDGAAPTDRPWTITEVAQEYGVTLRTLRFYEDRGLIAPERRGTMRLFHPRDRVRLALVLRGKRLGFSLEEIARIVDMYDAEPGEAGQLRYLLDQIAGRREDLEQRRRDIEDTLAELDEVEQRCRADLARLQSAPSERGRASGGGPRAARP